MIQVAGSPFRTFGVPRARRHCQECHNPVVEGDGVVRRERCHSCHGEVGHIERFGETAFLHEMHVTDHKVECFECHDEIHHGDIAPKAPETIDRGSCGACHVSSHDANRLVFSGTGAVGVEDRPSRMYETNVVCSSCHTGRSDYRDPDAEHGSHGALSAVASAGPVDCIHCHGIGYDGMLEDWQSVIGGELDRLEPMEAALAEALAGGASEDTQRLHQEARQNLELIRMDGSRGVHNPLYSLDVLRAAAERLDEARALVDSESEPAAFAGLPHVSAEGCSECHLGVASQTIEVHGRPFSHSIHLARAELDCGACHSVEEHGAPAFARTECASCHHEEREDELFDAWDCSACHAQQESFLMGTLEGFEETLGGMEEKDCDSCHGEPPDLMIPKPKLCVLCHDESYEPMLAEWRAETDALAERLEQALEEAARDASSPGLARARNALRAVAADGSHGAHNLALTRLHPDGGPEQPWSRSARVAEALRRVSASRASALVRNGDTGSRMGTKDPGTCEAGYLRAMTRHMNRLHLRRRCWCVALGSSCSPRSRGHGLRSGLPGAHVAPELPQKFSGPAAALLGGRVPLLRVSRPRGRRGPGRPG